MIYGVAMLGVALLIGYSLVFYTNLSAYGVWIGLATGHLVAAFFIMQRLYSYWKIWK
jgi:Na+-driven multidrug efflux pump